MNRETLETLASVRDAAGPASPLAFEWGGSDYRRWKRVKSDDNGTVQEL